MISQSAILRKSFLEIYKNIAHAQDEVTSSRLIQYVVEKNDRSQQLL